MSERASKLIVTTIPCRPMPIEARVILSLGGTKGAPNTWRGTIVNAAAAAKVRRVSESVFVVFMAILPSWSCIPAQGFRYHRVIELMLLDQRLEPVRRL